MSDQTHVRCPYKDCGSSDAFSWNHNGYGQCHSCAQPYPTKGMGDVFDWVPATYPLKKRINAMTAEITGTTYKGIRGLDEDVSKLFGIQVQTSEGNVPVRYAYKYPHTIKYRDYNDKARTWIKDRGVGMLELFGPAFNSGSSKRLYLTEGEFDAASLYQILGKTFPVKSLPSASIGEKFIKHNHAYLTNFQEIVYAGELDDAGRKAADKLYEAYPDKFYFVPMSQHKDANDFLTNKDGDVLKWAALKPQRYSPDNFFCSDDAVEKAIREENPYEYIPTGHAALDGMCRGLVKGGITFIKAPRGTGKCLSPNQLVIMFDGSLKAAKDVMAGDKLLGPDSTPRTVLSTTTGKEEMFKVVPTKGDPWFCNRSHILATFNYEKGYTNISVDDYLGLTKGQQDRYVQYRTDVVTFKGSKVDLPYDPYFVGAYLGDGSKHNNCITLGATKSGMVPAVYAFAKEQGWGVSLETMRGCTGYHFTSGGSFKQLKDLIFDGDVRLVPDMYRRGSVKTRRALLAGLLDADAYYNYGVFEIVQKSEKLADDIAFIARSLGYAAYKKQVTKGIKSTGFVGTYFKVSISGDFTDLPLLRHTVEPRRQVKSVLRTNFHLESQGEGEYCGFELDGDKLFVLGDFTVTHNTEIIRYFEAALLRTETAVVALLHMEEMKSTTYRAMATYELGINVRTKDDAEWNNISEDEVLVAAKKATQAERTIIFEMRSHDDPLKLLDYVRLAATAYGADFVFVDHVQRLAYLSDSGVDGATSTLTTLGSRMAQLAKELNIGVIFISQVNDDGRTKYAASLEEEAIICIKLERDVETDDEILKNTTGLFVDKNRPFSKLGKAGGVYYDPKTTILEETEYPEEI